ncbi:BamA/TamA family outer membrane protein [Mucilaginibacter sp. RS28]|uniref:BamA/TamA family outer membrane protein n=1 Tax=Mucilaginibacter straminoryzae TaxID=2932774 RepID=A0A9X1X4F7_9SPHI|nr:BamA/TamA family outer membrane protein [Mucilaginibacter straminoryzae]MCJ8210200.1 BamA/TamA family outer membrane protein [Mucilaginibacter straminoryzae]
MTNKYKYLLLLSVFISACSNTKYLPKGEKLYTGGQVNVVDKDLSKSDKKALKADLEGLLRPKPNGSFLGLRPKLYLWNITQTNKTKGFRHWLHEKGEPPVLVSAVDVNKNSAILTNRLQNVSYFQAVVTGDTVSKGRTAKAVYTATTGPGYKIRRVLFPDGKDNLDTAVAGTAKESLLKVGDKYNLDVIKNERIRIDARLKEKGFYYFAPEDLIMRIDSTVQGHQVDVFVKVKDATPNKARRIYTINDIYVYPNYSLRDTSLKLDSAVQYRWYKVIDPRHTIRPFAFKNTVLLHPGEVYNRTDHNKSLNRFIELGPYKFVKNRFEDVSADSPKLNVFYQLTPYARKALQFETLFRTTSANYNGTQVNINWRHRNAFKGAELLTVTAFASTDGQIAAGNGGYALNQIGGQLTISWPRFISPWNFKSDNAFIPHTNLTAGYSIVNRSQLYNLNSYNASWFYNWKQNQHRSHELHLIDFTLVNPARVTKLYRDSIDSTGNPTLRHVIDRQFTIGPSYRYTYDNTTEDYRTNSFFYSGRVSLSTGLAGLINNVDQYVKLENEIRFFHKTGPNSVIAARVLAGVGVPMAGTYILPYSQQFFIGGANSLRGFRARAVGPGVIDPKKFVKNNADFIPDASGDIKLEANVEYRPKLFSIVRGALFVDAGNVWNYHSQPNLEEGTFSKNFLSQLAVDAGFGLRFDASILVLRTDFGFPLVKPWMPAGERYKMPKLKDGVFNLAIGYPF